MSPLLFLLQVVAHQFAAVTLTIPQPVKYVSIRMTGPHDTTMTFSGQSVLLPKLEPGLYSVLVATEEGGCAKTIRVNPGSNARYRMDLEKFDSNTGIVSGRLIEPVTKEPAGGFVVTASDGHATTTADDGRFVMVNVKAGTTTFRALYNDSVVAESEQYIARGDKQIEMKLGMSSTRMPRITDGLVAFYPFDNGELHAFGDQQTHGTSYGAQAVADRNGEAGGAIGFDGTNRAEIPDTPWQHTLPMSMSFWMKVDDQTPDFTMILSKYLHPSGEGWSVFIENKRLCVGYFRDGFTTWSRVNIDGEIRDGKWRHYVITVNETRLVLNVDKARIPSSEFQSVFQPTLSKEPIYIGRVASTYPGLEPYAPGFTGAIDDLCFYNRVLTDLEIIQLGE